MNISNESQILYVDDEPQSLKYFSRLFEDRFAVATAGSADEAIGYLEKHADRVAVLLTDQRMPFKTGVQLMEFVRDRYPNIVRILVTAYSDLDAAVKSVNEGGAFRYLTKPIDEAEMHGALLRACDYHAALSDRDRLMREKLSVLHRLIVMDRIRGLATAATALEGRLSNPWQALVCYIQQSPLKQRLKVQMEEILGLNMVAIAKREAEIMVRTVEGLLADTTDVSTGLVSGVDLCKELEEFIARERQPFASDDIELSLHRSPSAITAVTDLGMFRRLLSIVTRRLADIQEHPARIEFTIGTCADGVELVARGSFNQLTPTHIASLFAAAVPLHRWPIGLDMDMLGAFMIVHHLGGRITVEPTPPQGSGFRMILPLAISDAKSARPRDPGWFDTVYESLEAWESELLDE